MSRHLRLKILIGIIVIGGSILTYFYFLDGIFNPVFTGPNKRVYQTTEKEYMVGDDVIVYSSKFCKLRFVSSTITWFLVDDVKIAYPEKEAKFPTTCFDHSKIEVGVLPGFIGNTKYHFIGVLVYHLLVRDITVTIETNDFYVSPKNK